MSNILIIDDDRFFCDMLTLAIDELGHNSTFSLTLEDGIRNALSGRFDIILIDVNLPDGNGINAIPKIRQMPAAPEVIIITGRSDPDGADLAIRCGAWDYLAKPASLNTLTLSLNRAIEFRKQKQIHDSLTMLDRKGIIGNSQIIRTCLEKAAQAARSDASILITGETGTGKELFARAIHRNSARADHPFVVVDCGALPETLVESLLFGYDRGAFTGADKRKIGLIRQADGGTLFLDEIGELPLHMQKAFLRVLQEHRYRPIGGHQEEHSDFRLIGATNRNLNQMVEEGQFRRDLYFRLNSLTIELPALRERTEDLKELAMYFISKTCEKSGMMKKGFSPDFFQILENYPWPGNVRELFNSLDSALIASCDQPVLYPFHLPVPIRATAARAAFDMNSYPDSAISSHSGNEMLSCMEEMTFKEYRDSLLEIGQKKYFSMLVSRTRGNCQEACSQSGLSKSRLYHFLQKCNLSLTGIKSSAKES